MELTSIVGETRQWTMDSINVESSNTALDAPTIEEPPAPMVAPPYLPPKSPSSIKGKLILSTTNGSAVPVRKRRGRSKTRRRKSDDSSLSGETLVDHAIEDPSPDHLNVAADADDLSSTADFSMVSFEKTSPTSVVDPLRNIDQDKQRSHRRAKSWDPGDTNRSCLQVPSIFRRPKVMSADVASVSNASDTVVSVEKGRITGRELHENAKAVLNSGDCEKAVAMFEALQHAQRERFGEEHSSVGAAMHNVGVVRLRMEEHATAEAILIRAVSIRRKVLGNDHLDLAVSI